MGILQNLYNKIKRWRTPAWLKDLINSLWSVIKEIISSSAEVLLAQIKDLAIETCSKIQNDPSLLTNEDKRNAAFKEIKRTAEIRGLKVRDSLINLAIEIAVNFIKARGQ